MIVEPPPAPPPTTPTPSGKPADPAKPSRVTFGLQVAYGFFLPFVAVAVQLLIQGLFSWIKGSWSGPGTFLGGIVGMVTLLGGIWLASRRRWGGVLLGFILFGALIVLLIGACFVMLLKFNR